MTVDQANAWLMGSGVPSCTFLEVGTKHEGQITDIEMTQQRDYKTKAPKVWDDGSPMMQIVITLRTSERDPEIENDNGVRKLYVASKGMREALAAAVKKTAADGLALGGQLGMKYVRDGALENKGMSPPKEYVAKYEPPTHQVDDGYEDDEGAVDTPDLADYSEEPF